MDPDTEQQPSSTITTGQVPGAEADAAPVKADVGRRALAFVIDGAVAGVLGAIPVIGWLLGGAYILVRDGLDFDYLRGRSLGKTLMKLKPVRLDGQPMDIMTSVKRNWMWAISSLTLIPLLGLLLIPFVLIASLVIGIIEIVRVLNDPQGRRWGDQLAGTEVVETDE